MLLVALVLVATASAALPPLPPCTDLDNSLATIDEFGVGCASIASFGLCGTLNASVIAANCPLACGSAPRPA